MRKLFRVQIARTVFNTITSFGVVSPVQLNNACALLNIPMVVNRKNIFLMYFMMKEQFDNYEKNLVPTDLEGQQIAHIASHMHEDLRDYISHLEDIRPKGRMEDCGDATVDTTETLLPKVSETLSVSTSGQSHSEDSVLKKETKPKRKRIKKQK